MRLCEYLERPWNFDDRNGRRTYRWLDIQMDETVLVHIAQTFENLASYLLCFNLGKGLQQVLLQVAELVVLHGD